MRLSLVSDRYLGLDVGGTKCAVVLGNARGEILQRRSWASDVERGPDAMLCDLVKHARALLPAAAAGVAIGGPLDARHGVVLAPPHLPGWTDLPLKARLEDALGIPVRVEHDAAACALAEYAWGGWDRPHTLVYLTCGTGFGAGIIIDGRIYRGAGGHSIEIGHGRFADVGPAAFGKTGSIEAYCSGSALGLLAQWKLGRTMTPPALAAAARAGDAGAREILRLHAGATGQVCANLADLLFPDAILLGSLARHLDHTWLDQVRRRFDAEAHPHARQLCTLAPAALGERLQDLAALAAAQHHAAGGKDTGAVRESRGDDRHDDRGEAAR